MTTTKQFHEFMAGLYTTPNSDQRGGPPPMTHPLDDISLLQVTRSDDNEWRIRLIHVDGHTTNAFCHTVEATGDIIIRLLATGVES